MISRPKVCRHNSRGVSVLHQDTNTAPCPLTKVRRVLEREKGLCSVKRDNAARWHTTIIRKFRPSTNKQCHGRGNEPESSYSPRVTPTKDRHFSEKRRDGNTKPDQRRVKSPPKDKKFPKYGNGPKIKRNRIEGGVRTMAAAKPYIMDERSTN